MDERQLSSAEPALAIAPLLRDVGLTSSSSEALRMVSQGAVRIDGERVDDPKKTIEVDGIPKVFQVGKRKFARVTLTPAKN
jgi:tyrosyl-tRNA synthetase